MSGYRERVVLLDEERTLVGIMTEPEDREAALARPAFVVLNTGIIHRIGHNRMYVTFAREMARAGHATLRFDLSGLGDSGNRHGARPPVTASLDDIREAVDWATRRQGYAGAVLMGLCSGADQSVVYAGHDPRVVGMVLLDPTIPTTRRHRRQQRARRVLRRLARGGRRRAFLGAAMLAWRRLRPSRPEHAEPAPAVDVPAVEPAPGIGIHQPEVRGYMEEAYRRTADARIPALALLTAGLPHQHSYGNQIVDAFPSIDFGGQLTVRYLAALDHTFTLESERNAAFALIREWTRRTRFRPVADAAAVHPEIILPSLATGS